MLLQTVLMHVTTACVAVYTMNVVATCFECQQYCELLLYIHC